MTEGQVALRVAAAILGAAQRVVSDAIVELDVNQKTSIELRTAGVDAAKAQLRTINNSLYDIRAALLDGAK